MSQVKIEIRVVTDAATRAVSKFSNDSTKGLERIGKSQETIRSNYFQIAAAAGVVSTAISAAFGISLKKAGEFETGLLGVSKTVQDLSKKDIKILGDEIIALSKKTPFATKELLDLAKTAGQLGIRGRKNILLFAKSIAVLGTASNISGEEAAASLARISKLTGDSSENIENITSALVGLGNTFNANEGEIVQAALGIAQATSQFSVSSDQVLGFATAVKSLGIQSELARSTFLRSFIKIRQGIDEGGATFLRLQELTGLTGDALRREFDENAGEVFRKFIVGLQKTGNATKELDRIGLSGIRINAVLPVLAKNVGTVSRALARSSKDYKENTAAQEEFDKQAGSLENRMKQFNNVLTDTLRIVGEQLEPLFSALVGTASAVLETFNNLSGFWKDFIVTTLELVAGVTALVAIAATLGALIITLKLTLVPLIASLFGVGAGGAAAATGLATAGAAATSAGVAINLAFAGIPILIGLIVAGIVALVKNWEEVKKSIASAVDPILRVMGLIPLFGSILDDNAEDLENQREKHEELETAISQTGRVLDKSTGKYLRFAKQVKVASETLSEFSKAQDEARGFRAEGKEFGDKKRKEDEAKAEADRKRKEQRDIARLKKFQLDNSKEIIKAKRAADLEELNSKVLVGEGLKQEDQKRLEELRLTLEDEAAAKQVARELEREKRIEDLELQQTQYSEGTEQRKAIDEEIASVEQEQKVEAQNQRKAEAEEVQRREKGKLDFFVSSSKAQAEWADKTEKEKLASVKDGLEATTGLMRSSSKEAFAIGKAAAIAQATIKTYESAVSAYSSLAGIPIVGPALGAIAAAGAIAAGLANVTAISAQQPGFEQGGIVPGNSFSGDNVTANVNSGEMILNRQQQTRLLAMAETGDGGGGSKVIESHVTVEIDGEAVGKAVSRQVDDGLQLGEVI